MRGSVGEDMTGEGDECGGDITGEGECGETCLVRGSVGEDMTGEGECGG